MEKVHSHIRTRLFEISLEDDEYKSMYQIVPKRFSVESVSSFGLEGLTFERGKEYSLTGILMTERYPGMGRVFFFPYSTQIGGVERYIEVKGYGQDGHDMNLFLHCDGDIHFGMFYKNARKEYKILQKATEAGLYVPLPILLGKISRKEWLLSGARSMKRCAYLFRDEEKIWQIDSIPYDDISGLENFISSLEMSKYREDSLSAYGQPYDAGLVMRAPISPFRLGDPSEKYDLNERNKTIARKCGETFAGLLELGYLHMCPGTGNWTTVGELTDMSDCYNIKKDKNIDKIVHKKESEVQKDYWEWLLCKDHMANLGEEFIKGFLGERCSLKEAATELKNGFYNKLYTTVQH